MLLLAFELVYIYIMIGLNATELGLLENTLADLHSPSYTDQLRFYIKATHSYSISTHMRGISFTAG